MLLPCSLLAEKAKIGAGLLHDKIKLAAFSASTNSGEHQSKGN
jgi:hypothetical protein